MRIDLCLVKRDIDMIAADMLCLKDNGLNDRSMK